MAKRLPLAGRLDDNGCTVLPVEDGDAEDDVIFNEMYKECLNQRAAT
ncbi:hypothetical protein FACS1894120_6330 [Clostridia bacterium]|nr:hypothetical protein FACS1894120_6330 [Clostridia bacterium]